MTARTRAYRSTHAPDQALDAALPAFHQAAESLPLDSPAAAQSLARTLHLPVVQVRAAASSYDDAHVPQHTPRTCTGTSCFLAGNREPHHGCKGVYCLGYCDRSPAALSADGFVIPNFSPAQAHLLAPGARPPHPAPPSIRAASRHAVVTHRLLRPTEPPETAPAYDALAAALRLPPDRVIADIAAAGLKGRGGAAFPAARKLQAAAAAHGEPKFIVANGDEGDPGSFIDRELMERDPHAILEGMAIAAHAIGASRGYVFIRSEYPVASDVMSRAVAAALRRGSLGPDALGHSRPFIVEIIRGLGSYVCGEESALLSAIEGERGEVRPRPPLPVHAGLFGLPTVVANVETLCNLPWIALNGPGAYTQMGTPDSPGTKAVCLNHGFANPGIVEIEFGLTLRELIERHGGGGRAGAPLEAVLLGGPMGSIVTPDQWDVPVCYTAMSRRRIVLGHAGLVAIPAGTDWNALLLHMLTFMRDESCGKCVPCRMGTLRAQELAERGHAAGEPLRRILDLMKDASLCAFGRETPGPILTILEKFGDRLTPGSRP